jgi:hypothetical protein
MAGALVRAHATFKRLIEPIRRVSRCKWLIWLVVRSPAGSAMKLFANFDQPRSF